MLECHTLVKKDEYHLQGLMNGILGHCEIMRKSPEKIKGLLQNFYFDSWGNCTSPLKNNNFLLCDEVLMISDEELSE